MIITQTLGNINTIDTSNKVIDWLPLQWFETSKRILRKKTLSGKEVALKFLNESTTLTQGDIVWQDEQTIIAIDVLPCDCLVIQPKNMFEMASVCYEIGNKHLPLFYENDELLVPFELPLQRLLMAQGYEVRNEKRKLLQSLKTTVAPHGNNNESLFSRIMKLSSNE
ncbi:MAG: urease accessory protein UreE [Sphingobacteriales bacterium]|nr:urease accessory protein UreE [Sphingobacteriales bacterium]